MNLLYRIKIVDEQGVFVRYATAEEMKYLRVNADGKVEMLDSKRVDSSCKVPKNALFFVDFERGSLTSTSYFWQDVSDTHKVEWGIMTSDKHCNRIPIYDGDIYVDWNTGLENEHTKPSVFHIWNMEHALDEMFPMIEVIGNANLNPELLEKKHESQD